MSLLLLSQVISDHWCILFPLYQCPSSDWLTAASQQSRWRWPVKWQTCYFQQVSLLFHTWLPLSKCEFSLYIPGQKSWFYKRDVGYQALDCDTHILCKWPYYGPWGLQNSPRLLNNQSHHHQGNRQGRLEASFPLPLMDDFHLLWKSSFDSSWIIEDILKMPSCGPKQSKIFSYFYRHQIILGNAK